MVHDLRILSRDLTLNFTKEVREGGKQEGIRVERDSDSGPSAGPVVVCGDWKDGPQRGWSKALLYEAGLWEVLC